MGEQVQEDLARQGVSPAHLGPLSSYDLEKLHKKHNAACTDQERRNAVKQSQYLTYSAKINGRLSSTNYNQQWWINHSRIMFKIEKWTACEFQWHLQAFRIIIQTETDYILNILCIWEKQHLIHGLLSMEVSKYYFFYMFKESYSLSSSSCIFTKRWRKAFRY